MLDTQIDGYKKLLVTLITILAAGCVYWFTPATASIIQQFLNQVVLPCGIIILGMVFNQTLAGFDRAKILAAPPQLRRMVSATAVTGIEPIIYAVGSLAAALIVYFVHSPGQAETLQQLLSQVALPLAILILGGHGIAVQTGLNRLKLAPINQAAVTGTPAPPLAPPPLKPIVAPQNEDYVPINMDDLINKAKNDIASGQTPLNDLNLAIYFKQEMVDLDGRTIPKDFRIAEFTRLVDKSLELFGVGFTSYTNIKTPPSAEQVAQPMIYYSQVKKDYIEANHLPCGSRTFENLKRIISEFNELYQAQFGLQQLAGKVCDWSIYGGGNFGPQQAGMDWVELST